MDSERADVVSNALQNVDARIGITEGDIFALTDTPQEDVGGEAGAAFHTGRRSLYVKPDPVDRDQRQQEFEAGWLATETPEGSVYHEMVHSKHSQAVLSDPDMDLDELRESDFDTEEKQLISEEVSSYAATNQFEFVAEVGSAIMERDQEYSDEIMDLYDDLGGPEV